MVDVAVAWERRVLTGRTGEDGGTPGTRPDTPAVWVISAE